MSCLGDVFQKPNVGLDLQSWNTQLKTFVVLVQQEKIDLGELYWIKMSMTEWLQLTGIEIQSMFDIIPPPLISLFQTSKYHIFFLPQTKTDQERMGNITISLIKVDSGVYVKKMSTC